MSFIEVVVMQVVLMRQLRQCSDDRLFRGLFPLKTSIDSIDAEHQKEDRPDVGHRHDGHQPGDRGNRLLFLC